MGNIGVLCVYKVAEEGFIAGLLVVDSQGEPVEFRATETLTPTKMQRVLYGGSLRSLVAPRLLAKPLFDAARNKPLALLTNDGSVLSLRGTLGIPLALVTEDDVMGAKTPATLIAADGFGPDVASVKKSLEADGAGLDPSELMERVLGAINLVLAGK